MNNETKGLAKMTDTRDIDSLIAEFHKEALRYATRDGDLARRFQKYADRLTALQAGAGDGWLPIKTAPKDGTQVFVYVPGDSNYPTAAYYSSKEYFETEYGDPDYMDEGWYWSFGYPSDFHEETIEPTHWMPIPESPEAIGNAQATEGE